MGLPPCCSPASELDRRALVWAAAFRSAAVAADVRAIYCAVVVAGIAAAAATSRVSRTTTVRTPACRIVRSICGIVGGRLRSLRNLERQINAIRLTGLNS